jgi:alpha-glucosidase (family GH31 glycosyl hydrolase)
MMAFILNILDATGYPKDRSAGKSLDMRMVGNAIVDVIRKDGKEWWQEIIKDFITGYEK